MALDGTGARFAALHGGADHDSSWHAQLRPERASIPPGPELLDFDLRRIFTDPIPDQHCSLQALLTEAADEPVVVLHDTTFLGSWPILLGAPGSQPTAVIGLGITVVPISSMDTAPFGLGLPPDSSEEGRARNREANALAQEQQLAGAQAHLVEVLNSLGATEAPPLIIDGWVSVPDYRRLGLGAGPVPSALHRRSGVHAQRIRAPAAGHQPFGTGAAQLGEQPDEDTGHAERTDPRVHPDGGENPNSFQLLTLTQSTSISANFVEAGSVPPPDPPTARFKIIYILPRGQPGNGLTVSSSFPSL